MRRGPKSKPRETKIADGSFRKVQDGGRIDTAAAKGRPLVPIWAEQPELELYKMIVEDLPASVLGRMDGAQIEELLTCHRQLRVLRPLWFADPGDRSLKQAYLDTQKQFMRLASEFGLSPAARAGMRTPEGSAEESPMFHLVSKFG